MGKRRITPEKRDWFEAQKADNGLWEVVQVGRIPGVAVIRLPAPGIGPRYFVDKAGAQARARELQATHGKAPKKGA